MTGISGRRVLLVHRHFDPDMTTYAQMLAQFANHLGTAGYDVTVLCGPANYNGVYAGPTPPRREQRSNYRVRRVRLPGSAGRLAKFTGFALFPVAVVAHCWFRRRPYDVVSVTTMPPVVMGVAGRLAALRRPTEYVYHCMDLYPEVLGPATSRLRRAATSVVTRVDLAVMRAARQVIVLSDDMRSTVRARSPEPPDVAVSNNFIIERHEEPIPERAEDTPFRFVFAGNLGRFQGIDRLLEAFAELDGNVELRFVGAGPMTPSIQAAASEDQRISHQPHLPLRDAMQEILRADAAVVSLQPGVIATAFPSKLLMYLELGRRILALVEPNSELAETVANASLGTVADPTNTEAVTAAMRALTSSDSFLGPAEIQAFGRQHFSSDVVLERWTALYGLQPT